MRWPRRALVTGTCHLSLPPPSSLEPGVLELRLINDMQFAYFWNSVINTVSAFKKQSSSAFLDSDTALRGGSFGDGRAEGWQGPIQATSSLGSLIFLWQLG